MSSFYDQAAPAQQQGKRWDLDEYRKRALEREEQEKLLRKDDERRSMGQSVRRRPTENAVDPAERTSLLQREGRLDLEARIGKTTIATSAGESSASGQRQPGFYCEACDCVLKDSMSYLDHINGRRHQQNVGQTMVVERSTLEQVRARLEYHRSKRGIEKRPYNLDEQITLQKQRQEEERQQKRERKQEKKQQEQAAAEAALAEHTGAPDDAMAMMMGFSGFGSSKKA